jgi:pSer/pThr/pTyr-binding forkhead associated (FHA) protein
MEAANLEPTAPAGELVVQTGRQAGTRRPLHAPLTLIGRSAPSDIRLNVNGIDPVHCVVVVGADGLHARDLDSSDGTHVNGERITQAALRDGDLLKIGPIEFRVVLPEAVAVPAASSDVPEALRIQAAAVAAQQAGLDEEEIRLQNRRSDLQRQEEQLATHLAEKQQEAQRWCDYTQAEREALQKEKLDQDRRLAEIEAELQAAKDECRQEREKLTQERRRIATVYARLRGRWKSQWAAERAKHHELVAELRAERNELEERHGLLRVRETVLEQEIARFNAACDKAMGQLHDARAALTKERERWRRRRALEVLAIKNKERALADGQHNLHDAGQLLVAEKNAWREQVDALQKELLGLNNRIVNQRARVQTQQEEIARLDSVLRERQKQAAEPEPIECEVEVVADTPESEGAEADLNRVSRELADQRVHLVEQFAHLAEIQEAWQEARNQAAADLDALAQRLQAEEQALADRARTTEEAEAVAGELRREAEAMRRDVELERAQLQARTQAFEHESQQHHQLLVQKEKLLQEQLANLTLIRARWNTRRQEEVGDLQSQRALVRQQQKETLETRVQLFGREQEIAEQKRLIAEKAQALEQYRQEVMLRTKDPDSRRRLDRLRRHWLTLNAAIIRNAKREREAAKVEMAQLESMQAEMTLLRIRLSENDAVLTEKEAELDERAAAQEARQAQLDAALAKLEHDRRQAEDKYLRLQDEVETLAKAMYDQPGARAA